MSVYVQGGDDAQHGSEPHHARGIQETCPRVTYTSRQGLYHCRLWRFLKFALAMYKFCTHLVVFL